MKHPEIALSDQCHRITKNMRVLMQDISELTNTPDDEAAYSIIHEIRILHDAITKAFEAGV